MKTVFLIQCYLLSRLTLRNSRTPKKQDGPQQSHCLLRPEAHPCPLSTIRALFLEVRTKPWENISKQITKQSTMLSVSWHHKIRMTKPKGYFLKQDAILLYSWSSETVSTTVKSFREVAGRAVLGLENSGVICHTKPILTFWHAVSLQGFAIRKKKESNPVVMTAVLATADIDKALH